MDDTGQSRCPCLSLYVWVREKPQPKLPIAAAGAAADQTFVRV